MDSDSISLTTESQYIAACLKPSIANTCVFFCLSSRFPFSNSKLKTRAAFWNENANTPHPPRFFVMVWFWWEKPKAHTKKERALVLRVFVVLVVAFHHKQCGIIVCVCVFAFSTRDNDWIESNWTDTHSFVSKIAKEPCPLSVLYPV